MSSEREILALRREMLVARAAVQRAAIDVEVAALRERLRWPRAVAAIASTAPARSAALGLVLLLARGRIARIMKVAALALAAAKLALALVHRRSGQTPAAPPGD